MDSGFSLSLLLHGSCFEYRLLSSQTKTAMEEIFLGNGIDILWLRLAERHAFQERIQVAEEFLLPFANKALSRTLAMETAQHTYRRNGAVRILNLANDSSLSLRQYERRFATEIGITPRLFARMIRFQVALDAKRMSPQRSWLTIAHQLGYFDQMHMVHDFKSLGGKAPSKYSADR